MTGLHIDRPCRVRKAEGRWEWTCLCLPSVWPCTGRETTWQAAQSAATDHMAIHPAPAASLAAVIDLAAYRVTKVEAGARVLAFARPSGGAA